LNTKAALSNYISNISLKIIIKIFILTQYFFATSRSLLNYINSKLYFIQKLLPNQKNNKNLQAKSQRIKGKMPFDIFPFFAIHCHIFYLSIPHLPHMPQNLLFMSLPIDRQQIIYSIIRMEPPQKKNLYKQNTWKCTGNKQQQLILQEGKTKSKK